MNKVFGKNVSSGQEINFSFAKFIAYHPDVALVCKGLSAEP